MTTHDPTERFETVDVWFLEMRSRDELRPPAKAAPESLRIEEMQQPSPAFVRFFYAAVGHDFHWVDRLSWSEGEWRAWLDRPQVRLFVAYDAFAPAGFLLLDGPPGGDAEVAYFGVLPEAVGRGIGGALLHRGVDEAWSAGAERVWLHTCSLDAPAALPSYRARGFAIYDTGTRRQRIVARRGPW